MAHRDAARVADRLMARFGSIGALFAAPDSEIRAVQESDEQWADSLLASRALFQVALDEDVRRSRLDSNDPRLRIWLRNQFIGVRIERLLALFGDNDGGLIACELVAMGDRAGLTVSARTIFHRALALDAAKVIVVHNHPGAPSEPSETDIVSTHRLAELGRALGVCVDDHLIVGAHDITSLAQRGLM